MRCCRQFFLQMNALIAFLLCWAACGIASAQFPPAAVTPPMGGNSWNHFGTNVSDADVRAAADALVATGMRDAGYLYVNVDDSWCAAGRSGDAATLEVMIPLRLLETRQHFRSDR